MRNAIRFKATMLLATFLLFMLTEAAFFANPAFAQSKGKKVKLHDGTVVVLKLMETIEGGEVAEGQGVMLQVMLDVKADDRVVIKAGTRAFGTVTKSKDRQIIGMAGEVHLLISHTMAVDGQRVSLRGAIKKKGREKFGLSLGVGLFLCPLFLLVRGGEGQLNEGVELKTFVENPVMVRVAKVK